MVVGSVLIFSPSSIHRNKLLESQSFLNLLAIVVKVVLYQVSFISHNKLAIFSHLKMTSALIQEINFLADDMVRQAKDLNPWLIV
ncbi:hypothetical protein D4Z78_01450 [Okeania hirsuta]|nr:hypothetical protein D4Z78_01450 [Okeania hirsuta]